MSRPRRFKPGDIVRVLRPDGPATGWFGSDEVFMDAVCIVELVWPDKSNACPIELRPLCPTPTQLEYMDGTTWPIAADCLELVEGDTDDPT